MEYLSYFSDAYLFYFVPKFSYSHKVQIVNARKVYCVDNGFIETNSVSFNQSDVFTLDDKTINVVPFYEWAVPKID